jgi:hypothetical protein
MQTHNPVYFAGNGPLDWKILMMLHEGIEARLRIGSQVFIFAIPAQFNPVAGCEIGHH